MCEESATVQTSEIKHWRATPVGVRKCKKKKNGSVTATKYKWICTNCSRITYYIWQYGCQGSIWLLTKRKELQERCVFWSDKKCCPKTYPLTHEKLHEKLHSKKTFLHDENETITPTFTHWSVFISLIRVSIFRCVISVFMGFWRVFIHSTANLDTIPCSDRLASSLSYSLSLFFSHIIYTDTHTGFFANLQLNWLILLNVSYLLLVWVPTLLHINHSISAQTFVLHLTWVINHPAIEPSLWFYTVFFLKAYIYWGFLAQLLQLCYRGL